LLVSAVSPETWSNPLLWNSISHGFLKEELGFLTRKEQTAAQQKGVKTCCYTKVGDTLLTKSGRKVSRWTVIAPSFDEQRILAKNLATNRTRKFAPSSDHIVIPPDAEVPESLRKQLPKDVGVCRATGPGTCLGQYKLYSKTEFEVIDIQQESIAILPLDFTVEDGEPAWSISGEHHLDAHNIFLARNQVKLPTRLTSEIESQIREMF